MNVNKAILNEVTLRVIDTEFNNWGLEDPKDFSPFLEGVLLMRDEIGKEMIFQTVKSRELEKTEHPATVAQVEYTEDK